MDNKRLMPKDNHQKGMKMRKLRLWGFNYFTFKIEYRNVALLRGMLEFTCFAVE
jgi:hypothetical protein